MNSNKLLTSLLSLILVGGSFSLQLQAKELVIRNVTLISAERKMPLKHASVRIQNSRIIEVSASEITPTEGALNIDGTGKFLIPGLMDSHVHLTFMPGIVFNESGIDDELLPLQNAFEKQQPRSYLYHGFTQILDPAAPPATVELFNQQPLKPDLFYCGATPILGGYPTVFLNNDEQSMKFFPYFINQKVTGRSVPTNINMALHTPESAIARMKSAGAICNKIHIEDGFGDDSSWPMISQENIIKLRRAAHHNGMKVMAHANAYDMQKVAVEMNVDIIAHGMWNWPGNSLSNEIPVEIKKLLDKIIKKQIAFQPTIGVMTSLRDTTSGIDINTPAYQNVTPSSLLKFYSSEAGRWFQREMLEGFGNLNAEQIYKIQDSINERGKRVVKYLADNGGILLLASDTPSSPVYVSQPGLYNYLEMVLMARTGVPLQTIFEAATINNAKAFNLNKTYGTIEPGKIANLLLLNSNPLETIQAYNEIQSIILGGKLIQRESLLANN